MKKLQEGVPSSSPLAFGFVVGTTSLAFVVSQLDVSIVNIALPRIAESFSAGISVLQWIVDAYTIAFAVLMLSAGGMSDLLGAKRVFLFGLLLFGVASVGCGVAWDAGSLIGFRALQGVGSATMIPSSLAILNQSFSHDREQRARAVALWTAAGGVSIAAGPILGGFLIHLSSWRLIFLVNIPICLVGILLGLRLPESERHPNRGFDIPGQLTWLLALTAFIGAIIEWNELGFSHPFIWGGILCSGLLILLFLRIERRSAAPILPLDFFRSANFNVLVLLGVCLNNSYYGTVFVLSLYLQDVLHYTPLHAGLAFLPLTAGFIVSNLISGKLMAKYGTRLPVLVGALVGMSGFMGLLMINGHTSYIQLFLPFFTIPMGMGLAVPAMTTGILATVDRTRSGTASAVLNTTRQAAGALGVAVFGAMATGGPVAIVDGIHLSALISAAMLMGCFLLLFRHVE
ncbi:MFS transporter [Chitinophaga pendula]|uniref:MFS transporter n=1 Tax=Chitinophaga TaxID=79328 RepID=UPI0012FD39BE|nr:MULTISPECIES: MFS transporter [Chitinophaga]UCJ09279.1 MFS transporter [Chitinophaga pendula]